MPWPTGKGFAKAHNKKLHGEAAQKAADQATAMVNAGVPEGIAIATANKRGDKLMRKSRRATLYDHPRSQKKET